MTARAAVGELATQIRGVSYKKGEASSTPRPETVGVVRAGNIADGELTTDNLVYVPANRVTARQLLRKGDVLIATSSGSIDVVGKAARIRRDEAIAFGAFCRVLRPTECIDPGFLAHYFQTATYRRYVSKIATGTSINNLKTGHLEEIEILLPPIEEQRRIASVLDAADALRARRRQAIARLDSLRQAVFIDMFGDPTGNPKKLSKAPLSDLIKVKSGESLTGKAMRLGPHLVYGGNGVSGSHDEYMFDERQIVIGRVGVYCGCVHVSEPQSWITDNALYVHSISPRLRFSYLAAALALANLNKYANQAAQPLISGSRLYPVKILVPDADDQRSFEQSIRAVDALRRVLDRGSRIHERLFASIQQRAFRGEL